MNGETNGPPTPDTVVFNEIQVLLAEKRTALRTGIAVFALPLSVLSARNIGQSHSLYRSDKHQ
jgi:hypothetical protein